MKLSERIKTLDDLWEEFLQLFMELTPEERKTFIILIARKSPTRINEVKFLEKLDMVNYYLNKEKNEATN
jgi:hypothetical protein